MFANFKRRFSQNLSIDLGTANVLLSLSDKGLIVNEPSVVAINIKTKQILAIGHDAKRMIGRTPPHIEVTKPLDHGIIADFEVVEKMLKYFVERLHSDKIMSASRPRVVIGVPIGVTEVERKAVEDAVFSAGAKEVFMVEKPIAAALGSQIIIGEPSGNLMVDLGAGTTEIAVISLEGIVNWRKLDIAGDRLNQNIIQKVKDDFNVLLGETIAEEVKIKIGSAIPMEKELKMKASGRDLITGLPKEIIVGSDQITKAIEKSLSLIIDEIKSTLETTPPELVADIYKNGIILTGGGALLKGIDKLIEASIKIPVTVSDDPLTCIIRGLNILHEDKRMLDNVVSLINKYPTIK